jgi:hypothetical protein
MGSLLCPLLLSHVYLLFIYFLFILQCWALNPEPGMHFFCSCLPSTVLLDFTSKTPAQRHNY